MACILRSTDIVCGQPVDRHFIMPGEDNEIIAADALRNSVGGEVTVVGRSANGATDYFPARAPRA